MLRKLSRILNRTEDVCLVLMFAAMVGIIFVQVIMRYVFKNSLSWSEELGKFLFVWLSWFGISIGARRGEHIKITLFTDKLPHVPAQITNILSELIVLVICGITAYYGAVLVENQSHVRYAGIKISMSYGYLSVTVGCVMMMIRNILSILQSVEAIRTGIDPRIGQEGA